MTEGADVERQQIFEAVQEHLEGRGIDREKVVIDADLLRDLDLDSLDTMELTLGMEERFGIEIPDSDLETLATVRDAVTLIERKLTVSA
jgi:acyl carrier protein